MQTLFGDAIPSAGAAPNAPLHTVFFGLFPPLEVARRAYGLARDLGQGAGSLRPGRGLHVLLLVVGKDLIAAPPAGLLEGLRACASTVKQRPFALSLNRVEAWNRSAVVLGDEGVVGALDLHRRLAEALGASDRADFNPHMTLLYGRGPSAPLPVPPIAWMVRDFVLIHSFVGQTRYE